MAHGVKLFGWAAPDPGGLLAFFLVVPPLIVFFGAFLLFDMAFGDCRTLNGLARELPYAAEPTTPCAGAAPDKTADDISAPRPFENITAFREASGRITWLTTAALVLLIGLPGLYFVWRIIWKHQKSWHVVFVAAIVLVLFSGWLFIWSPTFGDPPRLDTRAPPWFPSVHLFNFHMTADLLYRLDKGFHTFAYRLYMVCFSLLVAVVLSGMFAACYALSPVDRDRRTSPTPIAERMELMRYMLYLGSLLLSVGIIFISAWLSWPATLLPTDQPLKAELSSLAGSVTMYWGAVLSALLLSVYVPSALCLRARARLLAIGNLRARAAAPERHPETTIGEADPQAAPTRKTPESKESEVKKYLQEHRLSLPFTNHLQQVVAVFAPALMSPLINTIGSVNILPA